MKNTSTLHRRRRDRIFATAAASLAALLALAPVPAPAQTCDIDDETGSWAALQDLPIKRHENATAKLEIGGKDYIFMFGQRTFGSVLRYDVDDDSWASSTDSGSAGAPPLKPHEFAPDKKGDHKKAVTIGDTIYIMGGTRPFDTTVWSYDGINAPVQLSNIGCNGASTSCTGQVNLGAFAAAVIDGQIYIAGGHCNVTGDDSQNCTCGGVVAGDSGPCAGNANPPGENTDRGFRYDPAGDDWFPIADMPIAVDHASGAAFGGKFYVFGGRQCGTDTACEGRTHTQIYNPATDSWSFGTSMPEGCSGMGHAVVMYDRMYVIGGEGGSCSKRAVQEYDPVGDSWRTLTSLPRSHHGCTPILVGDPTDGVPDRILLPGGQPGSNSDKLEEFMFDCEPCTGSCASCSTNGDCDDGLFCNGTETCADDVCQNGSSPCTGQICDESGDTCTDCVVDGNCDDGDACNGAEVCNAGTCESGSTPDCDDSDPCTTDSCDASAGCLNVPVDCNDGDLCTLDTCNSSTGQCEYTPTACTDADNDGIEDDVDPCTDDPRNLCFGVVAVDGTTGNDIRINANVSGAECSGDKTDCAGNLWHADYGYNLSAKASTCNLNGGGEACVIAGITDLFGCDDETTEDIFQCEHSDNPSAPELEYSFDVENGTYVVNFFFASTFDGSLDVGDRVIDILAEGAVVFDDFDQVVEAPGNARAVVRSAVVTVADGNGLQVGFAHEVENPAFKALEVIKQTGCSTDGDCDDGLYCNGAETCNAGECSGGSAVDCDDGIACTTDSCNESTDTCDHAPDNGACTDGLFCNGSETCNVSTGCQAGSAPNCSDGIACTDDACIEATDSCSHTPNDGLCGDGVFCNGDETCNAATGCQAGPARDCSDGIDCTSDSCNEAADTCNHTPDNGLCDDGAFCNGAETCNASTGCASGSAPDCSDGIACTTDACNEAADTCDHTPDDGACDDGTFCNGAETCNASTGCASGSAPDCSDGIDCTTDSCDAGSDACAHAPNDAACDDGEFCNGSETCSTDNGCEAGSTPGCDDGVDCTVDDCDEGSDSCSHTPSDTLCDDGSFCNGAETCSESGCSDGSFPCEDGVSCTTNSCDEDTDSCSFPPSDAACDDGNSCNGAEICDESLGCLPGETAGCSGMDTVCATYSCDSASGDCVPSPINEGGACDDGNECTVGDVCTAGVCEHSSFCGVPVSRADTPIVSDALYALRAGVSLETCDPCECDVNSDGNITVVDALTILSRAVSLEVELNCFVASSSP